MGQHHSSQGGNSGGDGGNNNHGGGGTGDDPTSMSFTFTVFLRHRRTDDENVCDSDDAGNYSTCPYPDSNADVDVDADANSYPSINSEDNNPTVDSYVKLTISISS